MTVEEKLENMRVMLDDDTITDRVLGVYLQVAQRKLLNHIYPYGNTPVELEPKYEQDEIELAIVLISKRGAEGQTSHNENSVNRKWRTEDEILSSIPRKAGLPK